MAAAERAGVGRFVHLSSAAVSRRGGAYSRSKADAEEVVTASPLETVVLRLGVLVWFWASKDLDGIVLAARAGSRIMLPGRGEYEVRPVLAGDAAAAIAESVSASAAADKTYTLVGEPMTLREFAEAGWTPHRAQPHPLRAGAGHTGGLGGGACPPAAPRSRPARTSAGAPAGSDARGRDRSRLPAATCARGATRGGGGAVRRVPVALLGAGALLLVLLAFSLGSLVQEIGCNQKAHYALVRALAAGTPIVDEYQPESCDLAYTDGHYYAAKAPGLAFAVLPVYVALDAADAVPAVEPRTAVWVLGLFGALLPALVASAIAGRLAERVAPRTGAFVAATLAVGNAPAALRDALLRARSRGRTRRRGVRPALAGTGRRARRLRSPGS